MSNNFYKIRPYQETDKSFIMASFLRGVYYGNPFYTMTPKDAFMTNYKRVGESFIANCDIKIACLADDDDIILSYIILSKDNHTLHWCFTKKAWRQQGLAKALMPKKVNTYTHFTELGSKLKHKLNAIFNPFSL